LKMGVGDRIKKIIDRRDWKQSDLAKKLGINKSVMSRVISGTRPVEDSLLLKLTEVLGVSADYLLGRDEKEGFSEKLTNHIINGLVDKYKLDLSVPGEKEKLEQFIKLYSDLRNP
jgi:transcriptional regulator with XRE-family HTH domain